MSADADPWLDPWLELVVARAGDAPVLELGCGSGRDTEVLVGTGLRVVALDLSGDKIAAARARVPAAAFHCQDVRAPFPAEAARARVVVASLSLHYFSRGETVTLFERVRSLLLPDGLLLCRLNSTNDVHHGAAGHPEIEKDLYMVGGLTKRFFDRVAVDALLRGGWRVRSLREQTIGRYSRPKVVWEIVADAVRPASRDAPS